MAESQISSEELKEQHSKETMKTIIQMNRFPLFAVEWSHSLLEAL